jgi:rhodanese-related sulfurtransferase
MPLLARSCLAALAFVAALPSARAQNIANADAVPGLLPKDRPQYLSFLAAPDHKAFAIGPRGQFGWVSGRDGWFMAELGAVYNCNKAGRVLCRVYAVDSDITLAVYGGNEAAGAGLLPQLKGKRLAATYAGEARDQGVLPQNVLHRGNEPGPTPVRLPGGRLITTGYLVEAMLGPQPPLLIDVDNDGGLHHTLPKARWLRGAGDDAGDKNRDIDQLFAALLAELAPGKDTPIVLFCGGPQCWLAYNAALRAVADGYINVYWYRGGIAAWDAANLPIVQAVVEAQLW